ncbi:MAG: Dabb family protein [Burkholderiales bacterium]|nr:Dabb family protein [Phycisphaerae bacterium]
MFVHVVLFWAKDDATPAQHQQLLDDCREYLGKIPVLKYFDVGRPAMTPREVVDNSYTVGLLTVFDDSAGHDAYQTDPSHLKFIERNKGMWKRVQIYDFA